MRIHALSFAAGVVLAQMQARLPDVLTLCLLAMGLILLSLLCARWAPSQARDRTRLLPLLRTGLVFALVFSVGFGWAALRAHWRLADELRSDLEGVDVEVVGFVADLPQVMDDALRFRFDLDPVVDGVPRRLLLSWYPARGSASVLPGIRPGERWRFVVRLKRPHGLYNPGGFDYEAWLLERGVRATGHVRSGAQRLDDGLSRPMDGVHRLREAVRERFVGALGDAPYAGILVALVIGDQRGIPVVQWEVFRRTGVAHLVAISGMHISLMAALLGGSVGWLWRRSSWLMLRCPVRKAQALAAVLAGTSYALLAGLGIPVQRALLMLLVVVIALYRGRAIVPSRVMALALVVVLAVDPWACLSAGFWLSFGAVAAIGFVLGGRRAAANAWGAALRIQLAVSFALMPLLVLMFQSLPLLSPLANAVAIPLVSFIVTPLVLLAATLQVEFPLLWAHQVTAWMMQWLHWLAAFEPGYWRQSAPPLWLGVLGVLAVAGAMLPRGTPGRLAALAVLTGLLAWPPARPPAGSFVARVLDVGQGLAVHVQTANHDLLFDTGPPFGAHADAGSRVLLPYLSALGVGRLDALVLSHDDSDHAGGANSIATALEVQRWWASDRGAVARRVELALAAPVQRCSSGEQWVWDGVSFRFLHPGGETLSVPGKRHDNDQSCVLRIANASGTLLLLGDVEAAGEAALRLRHGDAVLSADVLVSAHHGSRSSSSPALVEATLPEAVIHSAGHRNAFGHPHPEVWARWAAAGARNWRTDSQGAVEAVFSSDAATGVRVSAQRLRAPRYWHGR